jgi:hypothetical protein
MVPLDYNLVDAYNRELEDWWYEIPPAIDRFRNVVLPRFIPEVKGCMSNYFEDQVKLEIQLRMD